MWSWWWITMKWRCIFVCVTQEGFNAPTHWCRKGTRSAVTVNHKCDNPDLFPTHTHTHTHTHTVRACGWVWARMSYLCVCLVFQFKKVFVCICIAWVRACIMCVDGWLLIYLFTCCSSEWSQKSKHTLNCVNVWRVLSVRIMWDWRECIPWPSSGRKRARVRPDTDGDPSSEDEFDDSDLED